MWRVLPNLNALRIGPAAFRHMSKRVIYQVRSTSYTVTSICEFGSETGTRVNQTYMPTTRCNNLPLVNISVHSNLIFTTNGSCWLQRAYLSTKGSTRSSKVNCEMQFDELGYLWQGTGTSPNTTCTCTLDMDPLGPSTRKAYSEHLSPGSILSSSRIPVILYFVVSFFLCSHFDRRLPLSSRLSIDKYAVSAGGSRPKKAQVQNTRREYEYLQREMRYLRRSHSTPS